MLRQMCCTISPFFFQCFALCRMNRSLQKRFVRVEGFQGTGEIKSLYFSHFTLNVPFVLFPLVHSFFKFSDLRHLSWVVTQRCDNISKKGTKATAPPVFLCPSLIHTNVIHNQSQKESIFFTFTCILDTNVTFSCKEFVRKRKSVKIDVRRPVLPLLKIIQRLSQLWK